MAAFSESGSALAGVAKEIRAANSSETFESAFAGCDEARIKAITHSAFSEPFVLSEMVRLSFVVGGGKGSRAKYNEKASAWFQAALREVGYNDDRAASCVLSSAGTFKFQHDTGKNLLFVHVYPKLQPPEAAAGFDAEGGGAQEKNPGAMSPEWLCATAELDTFKSMVNSKVPAWIQKRRVIQSLREDAATLKTAEEKMMRREDLSEDERMLFEDSSLEGLAAKCTWLQAQMKGMIDEGHLTQAEVQAAEEQTQERVSNLEDDLCAAGGPKRKAKLETQLSNAKGRLAKLAKLKPSTFVHPLRHQKEIKPLLRRLNSLKAIEAKAGTKGAWSSKLSSSEAALLHAKGEIEEEVSSLVARSRCWFETDEELDERIGRLRVATTASRSKAGGGAKKGAVSSWATVPKKKKRGGFNVKAKAPSSNGFAGLALDDSDDEDD